MFNTLRQRFTISHLLPLLVVIPLMGLAFIYLMENQVVIYNLGSRAVNDASLVADLAKSQAELWTDGTAADAFTQRISRHLKARVMLLTPEGRLVSSSDPLDAGRVGQQIDLPLLPNAQAGRSSVRRAYSEGMGKDVINVLASVTEPGGKVIGLVRISYPTETVLEDVPPLRLLVGLMLAAGLLLGLAIAWLLAATLRRPLAQLASDADAMATGKELTPLAEEGPEEVRLLIHSFNNLATRLQSLEKARRQLLANLVHEIGRPLGALGAAAQALQSGADEDPTFRHELIAGIDGEVKRLGRLLDDLARLHDQVLGTLDLNRQPIALSRWLEEETIFWRETARQKGIRWNSEVPESLPMLQADPDRLGQVLGNLFSNAIKYTPSGGTVTLSAGENDSNEVWIRVKDTGPGIPARDQAHVFDPFYRRQKGRRFPQGMGLGLSIVHDLILAHNGRVEIDSAEGKGSEFTVWLPTI